MRESMCWFTSESSIFQQRKSWPWHQTLGRQPIICVTGRPADTGQSAQDEHETDHLWRVSPDHLSQRRVSRSMHVTTSRFRRTSLHTTDCWRHGTHAYYLKRKLFPCSLLSLVKSVLHLQMCVVFVMTVITSYTEPLPLLFQLSWMQNHVFLQYPTQLHQKQHECQRSLRTHRHTWGFNFIKRNEQKP